MAGRSLKWLPWAVAAGAGVPAVNLVVSAATGHLGANPVEAALNRLGLTTLVFLLATLACTPVRLVTGWTWPARVRRTLGLSAFAYATLHLSFYVGMDQGLDFAAVARDIGARKFQWAGLAAYLSLVPLALTSTNSSVRRLGFLRWQRLHRLAYAAGVLGVFHFFLRVKRDVTEPALYAAVLGALFLVRGVFAVRKQRAAAARK